MKKILISSLLLIASSSVLAVESDQTEAVETQRTQAVNNQKVSGFYLGAGYGSLYYGAEKGTDDEPHYEKRKIEGNSFKIYGGYQFNKIIAIEATYTDYGEIEGYVYNMFSDNQPVQQSPHAFSVAANAGYSFENGLRPFALVGISYLTLDSNHPDLFTDNRIAIKYGLGVDYAPSALKGLQLRVAYESDIYFSSDDDVDIEVFSLGAIYAGVSYKL
ncbi:MAG: porin family protein [Psychromonas sp.]|nr:porin family protein [Psychromonas sp.]